MPAYLYHFQFIFLSLSKTLFIRHLITTSLILPPTAIAFQPSFFTFVVSIRRILSIKIPNKNSNSVFISSHVQFHKLNFLSIVDTRTHSYVLNFVLFLCRLCNLLIFFLFIYFFCALLTHANLFDIKFFFVWGKANVKNWPTR